MKDWELYLDRFHEERAGITEELLDRCTGPVGRTPYDWLADGGAVEGPVVDVACGSGPMAGRVDRWVGIDRSHGELARANALGRGPLVLASSLALPIPTGRAAAVVVAMALMVVDDAVRFAYPTATAADTDLLIRSLYLPGIGARRVRLAAGVARRWGGTTVGIPLRRILARRDRSNPC